MSIDDFVSNSGAPASAGTPYTRVDRPNEGLAGEATTQNTNPTSTPTRANFDTSKAVIPKAAVQRAIVDTSGTSFQDTSTDVKRGNSSVW